MMVLLSEDKHSNPDILDPGIPGLKSNDVWPIRRQDWALIPRFSLPAHDTYNDACCTPVSFPFETLTFPLNRLQFRFSTL